LLLLNRFVKPNQKILLIIFVVLSFIFGLLFYIPIQIFMAFAYAFWLLPNKHHFPSHPAHKQNLNKCRQHRLLLPRCPTGSSTLGESTQLMLYPPCSLMVFSALYIASFQMSRGIGVENLFTWMVSCARCITFHHVVTSQHIHNQFAATG
jgi:hypothetical protein